MANCQCCIFKCFKQVVKKFVIWMEGYEYRKSETKAMFGIAYLHASRTVESEEKSSMIKHGHPYVIVPKMFQFFNFDYYVESNRITIIMWNDNRIMLRNTTFITHVLYPSRKFTRGCERRMWVD